MYDNRNKHVNYLAKVVWWQRYCQELNLRSLTCELASPTFITRYTPHFYKPYGRCRRWQVYIRQQPTSGFKAQVGWLCLQQLGAVSRSPDFLQAKSDFTRKTAVLRLAPLGGGVRGNRTYDVHLSSFESAQWTSYLCNWTFLLGATAVALYERLSTENRRFRSNGVSLTQNFK